MPVEPEYMDPREVDEVASLRAEVAKLRAQLAAADALREACAGPDDYDCALCGVDMRYFVHDAGCAVVAYDAARGQR